MLRDANSPEFIAARNAALAQQNGYAGHDDLDRQAPSGHAYGIRVSSRLTSQYRRARRKQAVDVTPQEVTDCLRRAGIKNWVLMGLHGYVGYLPMPRATQDVDVMIPYSQKARAIKAISERWPMLEKRELSQVVRFLDPGDVDAEGNAQPVIDLMLPWGSFQESILRSQVIEDAESGDRIPTLEAAIVAKYAALLSPHRNREKREYDAGDLRRLIKANHARINHESLRALASQVWEGGGVEIERFIELSLTDQPFPM